MNSEQIIRQISRQIKTHEKPIKAKATLHSMCGVNIPVSTKHLYNINLYNVGPTSKTLGRRCINFIQMFCVCCKDTMHIWVCILQATDPDLGHVIGRDGHLDQSHAQDLGQSLSQYRTVS